MVVRTGPADLGKWVSDERDIYTQTCVPDGLFEALKMGCITPVNNCPY
jgi:hypothetical protein